MEKWLYVLIPAAIEAIIQAAGKKRTTPNYTLVEKLIIMVHFLGVAIIFSYLTPMAFILGLVLLFYVVYRFVPVFIFYKAEKRGEKVMIKRPFSQKEVELDSRDIVKWKRDIFGNIYISHEGKRIKLPHFFKSFLLEREVVLSE